MERRALLTSLCFPLFVSVSGCLAREQSPRLSRVAVANFTAEPVRLEVRLTDGSETAYEDAVSLDANTEDRVVPSTVIEDELPEDHGASVLEYGLAGSPLETLELSDYVESDCGKVNLNVREETVEAFVSSGC
ncbi:uncharacterized protein Nmag_0563 [Natrialba magadii ATCC 43099]|uniref:Lipoprotein n=1 Tax=Natrialba magadii (strain ATCC 43099 / DSM 3394 / CCM 3739 / CIP 104546 / IAM 13178 / JCM 8861 / NBRC 102185 / NCIMB 2190 / MS3) TaxID=547559 RepID=D3SYN9_NATMM|nr:hypothetical protein [Natrialba magadii]ADD04150.1 uncharacterized protein Nmag_0563 [Natrialba magadii ATCC 43099]